MYVARQKGGRGLISCEMCVKAEENNMALYVRNSNERLMAGIRKINILDSEGAKEKNEFKRDTQIWLAKCSKIQEGKSHSYFNIFNHVQHINSCPMFLYHPQRFCFLVSQQNNSTFNLKILYHNH